MQEQHISTSRYVMRLSIQDCAVSQPRYSKYGSKFRASRWSPSSAPPNMDAIAKSVRLLTHGNKSDLGFEILGLNPKSEVHSGHLLLCRNMSTPVSGR